MIENPTKSSYEAAVFNHALEATMAAASVVNLNIFWLEPEFLNRNWVLSYTELETRLLILDHLCS